MTKKEMFANIATLLADNAEVVDFCNHEITLLESRKSGGNSKKTAESEAREALVLEALTAIGEKVTVTELIASAENEVKEYTNQRVSAILRKLVDSKKVVKTIEKKKAYFEVA